MINMSAHFAMIVYMKKTNKTNTKLVTLRKANHKLTTADAQDADGYVQRAALSHGCSVSLCRREAVLYTWA